MKNQLIYKIGYSGRTATVSWNSLSKAVQDSYTREKNTLPEYVIAGDLSEAIKKIEKRKLTFFIPREFTIQLQGNIL